MSDSKIAKRGLGRGLSALMADMDLATAQVLRNRETA